jgi:hypothetical protein
MSQAPLTDSFVGGSASTRSASDFQRTCDELSVAIDEGKLGDIVTKHEKLIRHYYEDVRGQAKDSFDTARSAAIVGFWVLIATLLYVLTCDGLSRFKFPVEMTAESLAVTGMIGLVSGALIEFVAAVSFWLYSRGAKQFGAFHICLERTHRYLLAYKIAEEIEDRKDETLRNLVCIMANAAMITRQDIDSPDSGTAATKSTQAKVISLN